MASFEIQIKYMVHAPRDDVFTAWSTPEILEKWYYPGGWSIGVENELHLADEKPSMREFENSRDPVDGSGVLRVGEVYVHSSEYLKVVRPEIIVIRWTSAIVKDSLITVSFFENSADTDVVLTHDGFSTEEVCEAHKLAWNQNLERLAAFFGRRSVVN